MLIKNCRKRVIFFLIFQIIFFLTQMQGCDDFFPTQAKGSLPKDHTLRIKSAVHKPGREYPFGFDSVLKDYNCAGRRCHHTDLQGGTAKIDDLWTVAPSCYQCHGKLWKDIDTSYSEP